MCFRLLPQLVHEDAHVGSSPLLEHTLLQCHPLTSHWNVIKLQHNLVLTSVAVVAIHKPKQPLIAKVVLLDVWEFIHVVVEVQFQVTEFVLCFLQFRAQVRTIVPRLRDLCPFHADQNKVPNHVASYPSWSSVTPTVLASPSSKLQT